MKLIWTGSDVLYATRFPKQLPKRKWIYCLGMKIFAKIADKFVQNHIVVSEHLIKELKPLKLKKSFEVRETPIDIIKIDKIKVKRLSINKSARSKTIIYYLPAKGNRDFNKWLYGYDIVCKLQIRFKDHYFHALTGKSNMELVYPYVDAYIRPNRHDGNPRVVRECQYLGIPVMATKENPRLEEFTKFIEQL